jgi:uncharacterized membrane protein YbhN (UPF0104 family)
MWRTFLLLSSGLALLYLGLCAVLFFFQRSLIYFPLPSSGTGGGTMITLPIAAARVVACARPKDTSRALIYFGGNAEDVSINLPRVSFAFPDTAVYLLHYRGYGGSSGKPSEGALFADALTLFDGVIANIQIST